MHEARSDSPLCLWSTWAHICSVWTTSASSSAKKNVWTCIKYHLSVRGQLRTDSWYKWTCVQTRWGVTVPPLLPLQALLVSPGSLPLCPAETTGLLLVIITQIVVDMDLGQIHLNSRYNDKGFLNLCWSFQPPPHDLSSVNEVVQFSQHTDRTMYLWSEHVLHQCVGRCSHQNTALRWSMLIVAATIGGI